LQVPEYSECECAIAWEDVIEDVAAAEVIIMIMMIIVREQKQQQRHKRKGWRGGG
jgi:hypothetical protein